MILLSFVCKYKTEFIWYQFLMRDLFGQSLWSVYLHWNLFIWSPRFVVPVLRCEGMCGIERSCKVLARGL